MLFRSIGSSHYVCKKRSDWIVVADQHQGIVTQEEFDRAQAAVQEFAERGKRTAKTRPLSGKVRCGVCGHVMFCARGKQAYYYCRTPRVTDQYDCPKGKVLEQDILDTILEGLCIRAAAAVEISRIRDERQQADCADTHSKRKALLKMKEGLDKQERQIRGLYEAFALGEIGRAEYLAAKAAAADRKEEIAKKIAQMEAALDSAKREESSSNGFVDNFQQYNAVEEITADIAAAVLQEVLVYPERRLEIKWRYQEDFERLMSR